MRYVDNENKDLIAWIATMLGYSPDHPESWNREVIDRILRGADKEADKAVYEMVRILIGR